MDSDEDYISKAFDDFFSKHDIAWKTSSPYTPQQNGMVEQAHRTIVEMARFKIHTQRFGYKF